jgi:hypothetical protein
MCFASEPCKYDTNYYRIIACVPAFAGLRRFPEGREFKQWTGDDSRALMKVYEGHDSVGYNVFTNLEFWRNRCIWPH